MKIRLFFIGIAALLFVGCGQTVIKSGDLTPKEQIARVTSKGGTTERAMNVLYERDLAATVTDAMKACTARAEEMSRTL